MTRASGKVPQISVVLGPAAGGAAYGPALTDIVILGPDGPDLRHRPRRRPLGDRRGRRRAAARRPGTPRPPLGRRARGHRVDGGRLRARAGARRAARQRRARSTPAVSPTATSAASMPESFKRAYDVHPRRRRAARPAARSREAVELHPKWAPNIVTALGRLRRPHRRRGRQQPDAPRRLPRLVVGREGRAVRADVRRLRGAPGRARRRAGLPAGRRPGVGRRGAARRQAAARLRRGNRARG